MQMLHRKKKSKPGECVSLRKWSILMGPLEFRTSDETEGIVVKKKGIWGSQCVAGFYKERKPRRSWVRLELTEGGVREILEYWVKKVSTHMKSYSMVVCFSCELRLGNTSWVSRTYRYKKLSREKREWCYWRRAIHTVVRNPDFGIRQNQVQILLLSCISYYSAKYLTSLSPGFSYL